MSQGPLAAAWPAVAALARARRISPLMLIGLAALAATTAVAAAFAFHAVLIADAPPASATMGWRPPILAASATRPSAPAAADVETLTRPVFSKTRRPAPMGEGAAAAANGAAPTLAGLTLGAIVNFDGSPRAYLVAGGAAEGKWLPVGGKIGPWTVVDIRELDLTVKNGDESSSLKLYPDSP
jgi:hypothetical protein